MKLTPQGTFFDPLARPKPQLDPPLGGVGLPEGAFWGFVKNPFFWPSSVKNWNSGQNLIKNVGKFEIFGCSNEKTLKKSEICQKTSVNWKFIETPLAGKRPETPPFWPLLGGFRPKMTPILAPNQLKTSVNCKFTPPNPGLAPRGGPKLQILIKIDPNWTKNRPQLTRFGQKVDSRHKNDANPNKNEWKINEKINKKSRRN